MTKTSRTLLLSLAAITSSGLASAETYHLGCATISGVTQIGLCRQVTAGNDVFIPITADATSDCVLEANRSLAFDVANAAGDTLQSFRTGGPAMACDIATTFVAYTQSGGSRLTVSADAGNEADTMHSPDGSLAITLNGDDGADTINIYSTAGIGNGDAGADILTVSAASGVLNGGTGNDTLTVAAAATGNGGENDDTLTVTATNGTINGDDGVDTLTLSSVDGFAAGGLGNDKVESNFGGGGEELRGNGGDDCLQQRNEAANPAVFDCGSDSGVSPFDRYDVPSGAVQVNCETTVSDNAC